MEKKSARLRSASVLQTEWQSTYDLRPALSRRRMRSEHVEVMNTSGAFDSNSGSIWPASAESNNVQRREQGLRFSFDSYALLGDGRRATGGDRRPQRFNFLPVSTASPTFLLSLRSSVDVNRCSKQRTRSSEGTEEEDQIARRRMKMRRSRNGKSGRLRGESIIYHNREHVENHLAMYCHLIFFPLSLFFI